MDWPCWIVLAPGRLKLLEPTISKIARHHRQDRRPWALVEGKRGYVAIIEEEPGSHGVKDEALAKALSKKTKKPAFIVTLDDDYSPSRVDAFARGRSKGKVKARASDVLVTLGFRFEWMSGGKKVALRLEAPMVNAKAGEAMIWHWSVSQWQQMRRRGDDWHILLDFAGAEMIDEIIGICGDPDAEVRFLGATMVRHVSYFAYFYEPFETKGPFTFSRDYNARSFKMVFAPDGPFKGMSKQLNMPADFVLVNRIQWGVWSILAQLGASGDWSSIHQEFLGNASPSTELGRLDATWRAART